MRKCDARRVRILIHQRGLSNPGNGNERIRFLGFGKGWCCRENRKNVPAIAENNDLEQGSPAQRHSCAYGGGATHSMVWFGFASLFIWGIRFYSTVNYEHKREKGTPFSIAFCTVPLVLDPLRQKPYKVIKKRGKYFFFIINQFYGKKRNKKILRGWSIHV